MLAGTLYSFAKFHNNNEKVMTGTKKGRHGVRGGFRAGCTSMVLEMASECPI